MLAWMLLWTFAGLAAALHHAAYNEIGWQKALWWGLKDWYLWGVFAVVIARLTTAQFAVPLKWPQLLGVHLLLALAFAMAHSAIAISLSFLFEDVGNGPGWGEAVTAHVLKKAPLNLVVYFAIAAVTKALLLARVANTSHTAGRPTGDPARPAERLLVKDRGTETFVDVARIDRIEAEGNYVVIRVGDKRFLERRTLGGLEKLLRGAGFMRIHRSHLVNLDRVDRIEAGFKGRYEVVMVDGTHLPMGRTYRKELKRRIGTKF